MPSVNQVLVMGHLGADPEVRYSKAGKSVGNCRIATSYKPQRQLAICNTVTAFSTPEYKQCATADVVKSIGPRHGFRHFFYTTPTPTKPSCADPNERRASRCHTARPNAWKISKYIVSIYQYEPRHTLWLSVTNSNVATITTSSNLAPGLSTL